MKRNHNSNVVDYSFLRFNVLKLNQILFEITFHDKYVIEIHFVKFVELMKDSGFSQIRIIIFSL